MRLSTQLALRIAALVLGVVLIGSAALWGLVGLGASFVSAADDYEQLRAIYQVGYHAASAQQLNRSGNAIAARLELASAMRLTDALLATESREARRRPLLQVRRYLQLALIETSAGINAALSSVADIAQQIQGQIVDTRRAVADRLQWTVIALAALLLVIVVSALVIGVGQYRSVMRPLRRLEQGVAQVADANFAAQLPEDGEAEFAHLARRFNSMARELDRLYHGLEQQVRDKSRQLVQSQRLAGVGYLAAGLAHEINNPLAIIGGYAEAALKQLPESDDSRPARALRVIAEEAFRCKQITAKLLSLARPEASPRTIVQLDEALKRVAALLGGLPQFQHRRIHLDIRGELDAPGNEAELTQVFINLLSNALEAVDEHAGEVTIHAQRVDGRFVIRFIDNGRGMDEHTLTHLFEPFFTDKPARGQRGIGLGLSVSHAIITQHHGTLTAHSDGPGKGSTFTVELPAEPLEPADGPTPQTPEKST